jgi:hypothetical protein
MNEPTITCPSCKTEIRLTESLAAPLIESTRLQYEERIAAKDEEVAKREATVREQQTAVTKAQQSIDEQVAESRRDPAAGPRAAERSPGSERFLRA